MDRRHKQPRNSSSIRLSPEQHCISVDICEASQEFSSHRIETPPTHGGCFYSLGIICCRKWKVSLGRLCVARMQAENLRMQAENPIQSHAHHPPNVKEEIWNGHKSSHIKTEGQFGY